MDEKPNPKPESLKPLRDELGHYLPGTPPPNPTGENGLKGRARWECVVEYYHDHFTLDDLKELVRDEKRMGKLSVLHAQVVTHLAATIAGGKERGKERERLYDRMYGKPKQNVAMELTKTPIAAVYPIGADEDKINESIEVSVASKAMESI